MLDYKKFITEFVTSTYFSYIFKEYDVLFVQVVGSQSTGYVDDHSDLDLVVICKNSPINVSLDGRFCLEKDGHRIHWYYINYKNYICPLGIHRLSITHACLLSLLTYDNILYCTFDSKDIIDYLLKNKYEIGSLATKIMFKESEHHIEDVVTKNLSEETYTKWLSHYLMDYQILSGEEVSRDLIMAIKRIRWQPTTEGQRQQCCEYLKKILVRIKDLDLAELWKQANKYNAEIAQGLNHSEN